MRSLEGINKKNLQLRYANNTWDCIIHALSTNGPNELQQYKPLGAAAYVQKVVHALNDRFPNLLIFNATKIFNPRRYPSDNSDPITYIELYHYIR